MGDLAKPVLVCCSVLRAEIHHLRERHWPDLPLRFLDSMLHLNPDRLETQLEAQVNDRPGQDNGMVLIYGDCCTRMDVLETRPGVVRTEGMNCCDILLGREEYHRLSSEGAFFLLPEWAGRWQDVFVNGLGLSSDLAETLMNDTNKKLVYIDTGLAPVPMADLLACARFCGLPCEVRTVSLDNLMKAIQNALERLERGRKQI